MRNTILAFGLLFLSCTSCATNPPTPDPVIGPDAYGAACANLAAIGCPEGQRENCVSVMQRAQEARLTDLRPTCLAAAANAAAARACGTVRCQ
jgi:hypothetical protein